MDLAIVSNYGLNSDGGGVKVYTQNLVKALQKRGIRLFLLIREGNPTEVEEKLPENKIFYVIKATRRLNKLRPKFVLSQGGWFTAIPTMIYKMLHPKAKIIHLYHTHYDPPKSVKQKIVRVIERLLMTFVLSRFDWILFVSKALKENIENSGALKVSSRWGVLYGAPSVIYPYPKEDEIKSFKEKFGIKESNFYLLGHGLTALKAKAEGAKLLIQALLYLPDNFYLILTRNGRFVEELRRFAQKLGVENRVIFTGDLENPHVATVLSDVYTHITFGEGGLSLALLEVMAIGKPIIASKVGGVPEAIRDPSEGILVENEVNYVVSAATLLMESPKLRRKMSTISKKAVNKRFSWGKTAGELLNFFSNNHS
ncbi:glycosyltransferase family 4 protein [Thermococcus sp. PK]|uniref:glycosyltransferase family 4 protein n=1 Tax=Thermococcus sp. PK TaxID=913025 RepID=UPI000AF102F6|nr:glycosyltransferase family 4 protein [Thermococcus sp. PK]